MEINAFCSDPFRKIRITSNGDVTMCGFQKPHVIGSLMDSSFEDIWFGGIADDIRQSTADGELHSLCKLSGCPFQDFRSGVDFSYSEYPSILELELANTHCNSKCIMCERSDPNFKPDDDYVLNIASTLSEFTSSFKYIYIKGAAEPFLDGLIFNILDNLKFDEHAKTISVKLSTNGVFLNKETRKEWFSRVPNSTTSFSIDAASKETYKLIRTLPYFDEVLDNLYSFSEERIKHKQFLRVRNNINTKNVHEVIGMVGIAYKAGVEEVDFSPTYGHNKEIMSNSKNCGIFKKAEIQIIEECNRLGVLYNFLNPLDMGRSVSLAQITL